MKTKQYAVEVLSKRSHGKYGKDTFQVWCLSETSKERAIEFGYEILAGMTYHEILKPYCEETKTDIRMITPFGYDNEKPIGYEDSKRFFTVKAYLYKGE